MIEERIKKQIRDVQDFPKKGIVFKDITPLLEDSNMTSEITMAFVNKLKGQKIDAIVGIESRGFFWGLLIAQALEVPFIPVRKKGKLPYKTISHAYELEYGTAEIEMHEDAIKENMNVIIHDDLLATGGTAAAAAELVIRQKAVVSGFSFLVILSFLNGEQKLKNYSSNVEGIVSY